jgi:hypothetical protein
VRSQRIKDGPNTAATYERHYDVNAISRMNLREYLIADTRFAGGIREQRGIKQRNQGLRNFFLTSVGQFGQYASQDLSWLHELLRSEFGLRGNLNDYVDQLARQRDSNGDVLLLDYVGDGSLKNP